MNLRALSLCVGLSVVALLAGCHRPFTKDNFELIQVGVDNREDVQHILGKPTSDLNDQWFYDDLKRHYSAVVFFDPDGRVNGKEWWDAKAGTVEGRNPNADQPPPGETPEQHKKTTRIDKD